VRVHQVRDDGQSQISACGVSRENDLDATGSAHCLFRAHSHNGERLITERSIPGKA
jgi:hypothetical protein